MDPWLEAIWLDVHATLIPYAREAIRPQLPAGLHAQIQQRVFVEEFDVSLRTRFPDLHIVAKPRPFRESERSTPEGGVATMPLRVRMMSDPLKQSFINIADAAGKVVTAIEFLSPTNKVAGKGRQMYLDKQREFRGGGVNLVEIDLVRTGDRVTEVAPESLSPQYHTPYYAIVSRAKDPDWVEVYPISLREPLPTIAVPLRAGDADILLALQPLLDKAYEMSGYEDAIDYAKPPSPALLPADAQWASEILKHSGRLG